MSSLVLLNVTIQVANCDNTSYVCNNTINGLSQQQTRLCRTQLRSTTRRSLSSDIRLSFNCHPSVSILKGARLLKLQHVQSNLYSTHLL